MGDVNMFERIGVINSRQKPLFLLPCLPMVLFFAMVPMMGNILNEKPVHKWIMGRSCKPYANLPKVVGLTLKLF